MSTLVSFHAHPDDEATSTGGSLARASAEGHRVVLVIATNGDYGESPDDLADGETLVDRRRAETAESAAALGVNRVVWLGYKDSGMTGWEQNADPESFFQASVDDAAARLAEVLREERADVLTVYDWHGNYGHPDHVKVHHVGHRAAELAGVEAVFEATMNRDEMRRLFQQMRAEGIGDNDWNPDGPADDGNPVGSPEAELTHAVDVSGYLAQKRASLSSHRSQVSDVGFLTSIPDDAFTRMFGTEWFIRKNATHPLRPGWLFE
jgi:LmbE family N-acetylglucosaminyl deacetylase